MKRIIVGVTGATGTELAFHLLRALGEFGDVEVHLVMTGGAEVTWGLECDRDLDELRSLADVVHDDRNLGAAISSGSFRTDGMIVIPCSMKTLAAVAAGYTPNLVTRAVDVCLKEERRVVLVPREMPLGKVHLRNLKEVADLGCSIVPPMLTFYNGPKTMQDQIDHVIGKIVRLFGLETPSFRPWTGVEATKDPAG